MSDNEQKAPVLGAEGGLVKPKGQPETSTKTSSAADVLGAEGGLVKPKGKPGTSTKTSSAADGSDATSMEQFVETLADALKRNTGTTEQDIRRNVRPPRAYAVGHNFKTWLAQFNQFAHLVRIRDADKKPYLLTLLDTPAFRAVELLKLPDTLTFGEFTAKLVERFDSGKTKADYKHQLRARLQKPNEDIEAYADCLMELAENAYPDTDYSFKVELARDQFVQGVAISEEMRERVFISQPESLTEAVRVVRHMESARKACKSNTSAGKTKVLNAVTAVAAEDKISTEIRELKELVLGMNKKIQELEQRSSEKRPGGTRRREGVTCYSCHKQGHFARDCPSRNGVTHQGNDAWGLPGGSQPPSRQ